MTLFQNLFIRSFAIEMIGVIICCSLVVSATSSYQGIPSSPLGLLVKVTNSCGSEPDIMLCLNRKTLDVIERASNENSLSIIGDTLSLVKDNGLNDTEDQVESKRSIQSSLEKFMKTHRLQLTLPPLSSLLQLAEGRGKKNKGYGMMGLMMGGSLLAMGMAALAALAGKALAASMAALMMAALAAFKKGGGGGGHHDGHHSSYEVISIPSHHRSFLEPERVEPPYKYEHEYN